MTRHRPPRRAAFVAALALVVTVLAASAGPSASASSVGTPTAWGGNAFGELGDGTTTSHTSATPVAGPADVTGLHAGREHVVALRADGSVVTWGSNQMGQLGIGATGGQRSTPVAVPGLRGVVMVSTGHYHSLALLDDGSVWTWGYNHAGQLGDGSTVTRNRPVRVVGARTYRFVAAGRDMSYAVAADGTVWAWGLNSEGQLGDGTTTSRTTPVQVSGLAGVDQVAGGRDHGLALRADGSVWAWGWNAYGQVGDGTLVDRTTPVQVTTGASMVAAGAHHSYALRSGQVSAWGRNYRNALGDGTTTQRTRPVTVVGLTGVVSIGSGRDHGLAALADGTVRAWGENGSGQLGDGTTTRRATPVVVQGATGVEEVSGGAEFSVGLAPARQHVPQPPVARIAASCTGLVCTLDAGGSTDEDGTIASYEWEFGDGLGSSVVSPQHTFSAPGTYVVTLTVTDTDQLSDTETVEVRPTATGGDVVQHRASAGETGNTARTAVLVPSATQPGDVLLMFVTTNRAAQLTTPAGWTVLGTRTDGTDLRSWALTRTADAGAAGSAVPVVLDATSKVDVSLHVYEGAGVTAASSTAEPGTTTDHEAPSVAVAADGSRVVHHWATKVNAPVTWTLPPGLTGRRTANGSGSGLVGSTTADGGPAAPPAWPARTAVASAPSGKAVAWTVVVAPSSA